MTSTYQNIMRLILAFCNINFSSAPKFFIILLNLYIIRSNHMVIITEIIVENNTAPATSTLSYNKYAHITIFPPVSINTKLP